MKNTQTKTITSLNAEESPKRPLVISGDGEAKKPTQLLAMFPLLNSKFNPMSRKIINVIIQKTQQQAPEIEKKFGVIPNTMVFEAKISDFADPFERGNSHIRGLVRVRLDELATIRFKWETPDKSSAGFAYSNENFIQFSFQDDQQTVKWLLGPSITELITRPGLFTPIKFEELSKLKKYASIALYEICYRSRTNRGGLTNTHSIQWWINALSESPPPMDEVTGEPKERNWPNFKMKVLSEAIAEINRETDITVTFEEGKTGKKITHLQFIVEMKKGRLDGDGSQDKIKISPELATAGMTASIDVSQLVEIRKNGLTEEIILQGLRKLEEQMARQQVDHPYSYLKRILDFDGHVDFAGNKVSDTSVQAVLPPKIVTPNSPFVSVLKTEKEHLEDAAFAELKLLPLPSQINIANAALKLIGSTPTANITRKINAGEWHGMERLKQKMIEIHKNNQTK